MRLSVSSVAKKSSQIVNSLCANLSPLNLRIFEPKFCCFDKEYKSWLPFRALLFVFCMIGTTDVAGLVQMGLESAVSMHVGMWA